MRLRLLIPAFVLVASVAEAAPVTFTNRAAFEAAIQNPLVYDLSGVAPVFNSQTLTWNLVYDGLTILVEDAPPDTETTGTVPVNDHGVLLNFATPRSVIGFDFTQVSNPFTVHVPSLGGQVFTIDSVGFFGVILDPSQSPFSQVMVFNPGGAQSPVRFGNVTTTSVPEPSTLALFGVGALCAVTRRRRRRPA